MITLESPNIILAVLSFVQRLSSFRGSKCIKTTIYRESNFGGVDLCPL